MSSSKVIYISYDGMTDPLGQSQVLPYLIGLSSYNYEIHLISFEKEERFLSRKNVVEKIIFKTNITWHPLKYHHKPPVLSTLYDIWNLNKKVNEITKEKQISIIHCRSYISSLIGLSIKRKKNIPFLFDMRGFWADERVDGNIWNLKNPIFNLIYRYFKNKEKQFIKECDYIISLTENAKHEIQRWKLSSKNEDNIQVIPCCADFDHFNLNKLNSDQQTKLRHDLGFTENDFIMSYVGSLGTWYMIDEMMDLFKIALSKLPTSKFLILTTDLPQIAFDTATKAGIDKNKIIVKRAERNEVPSLIALSQFSVFFIKPSYSKKASSPTKLAEILGMGVPVLCNGNVGDVQEVVEKGNVGVVINDFNEEVYNNAIDTILSKIPVDKYQISAYAKKYASLEDGIKKYHHVYQKIAKVY